MNSESTAQPESTDTDLPKKKSSIKKIGLWLVYILAIIIVVLALFLAWGLVTQSGREWLANTAVGFANGSENLNIKAVNVESPSLGLWTIENIELYVENKKAFSAHKFEFNWFPKQLLERKIHIKALAAKKVDVYLNISEEKPKVDEDKKPFSIPSLPYIELESFDFPSVNLHREISTNAGSTQKTNQQATSVESLENFTINGNFLLPDSQLLQLNLDAKSAAKKPLKISIKSTVDNNAEQQPQVTIIGSLSEGAGGDLASLIQFPSGQSLQAGIDATITPQGSNLLIDLRNFHFDISTPSSTKKAHKIKLAALGEVNTDSLTAIVSDLRLYVDNTEHKAYGSWDGERAQASLRLNKLPLDIVSIWYKPISSGYLTGEFQVNTRLIHGEMKEFQWNAKAELNTRYETVPIASKIAAQGNQNTAKIKSLNIQSNSTNINASGIVDIKGDANAIVFSISNLGTDLVKKLKLPLPHSIPMDKTDLTILKASGKISGKLTDPDANATVRVKGKYDSESFDGESVIEKKGDAITIEKLWIANNDTESTVSGKINIQTLAAELKASVNEFPLRLLALTGTTFPKDLNARVSSYVNFKGKVSPHDIINADIDGKISAKGMFDNIPFTLNADGNQSKKISKLDSLVVSTFDQKVLDVKGEYFEDTFKISVVADKLPTKLLEALNVSTINGVFSANVRARGDLKTLEDSCDISGVVSYTTEFTSLDEDDQEQTFEYQWTSTIETLAQETEQFPDSAKRLNISSKITREGKDNGDINIALPLDTYLDAILKKKSYPA